MGGRRGWEPGKNTDSELESLDLTLDSLRKLVPKSTMQHELI
jgi:hypothetical protein